MANGALLRRLFQSYTRRDDQAFEFVAKEIISEERQKHHNLLADELAAILDDGGRSASIARRRKTEPDAVRQLDNLPRDRERDVTLLEVKHPSRGHAEIILNSRNEHALEEILREYRKTDILRRHGLQPRRHLLFCGPPGCGKTLCAEVIAQELDLPLLYTRFDAIVSSYLGETAANLRKVFDYASRGSWVVFFDEFDAIGKSRDNPDEHGEIKRVVNSFLQLLDSFHSNSLVIAATNHEGLLDPALWRRFDEILYFDLPNQEQVLTLLEIKLRAIPHADIDLSCVAALMAGFTYADIERVCLDALRKTVLAGERTLHSDVLQQALDHHNDRLAIVTASKRLLSPVVGETLP